MTLGILGHNMAITEFTWRGKRIDDPRQWSRERGCDWVTAVEVWPDPLWGDSYFDVAMPGEFWDTMQLGGGRYYKDVKREPA